MQGSNLVFLSRTGFTSSTAEPISFPSLTILKYLENKFVDQPILYKA